jgi:hypothetical protein
MLGGGARGQRDLELTIEAAGAAERRVERIDSVGRSDEKDLAARVEAVHEGEERRDDGRVDVVLLGRAHGRQTVELIKEDDGRLQPRRLFE